MSENGNDKMVVVCNHADAPHVMPTLIMGASGASIGDDVMLFFCPGGAPALVKGELEKIREKKLKGLPDPVQLYDDILVRAAVSFFVNWRWKTRTSKSKMFARVSRS